MGLPIPIPSAPPLRALPTVRPNPLMSVPSGITQMVAPPPKILMRLPPRLPPLNLAPLANFFRIGSLITLPAAIIDAIGQAGAYKWRDDLLNQIIGGNSTERAGNAPFTGGQSVGVRYVVTVRIIILNTLNQTQIINRLIPYSNSFGTTHGPVRGTRDIQPTSQNGGIYESRLLVSNSSGVPYERFIEGGAGGVLSINTVITNIARFDGLPDTGGNPSAPPIGEPNIRPLTVPPIEPFSPPFEVPNYDPQTNPLPLPNPNPLIKPNPSPQTNPLPLPNPNPLTNPLPNPNPNPSPPINPFPSIQPNQSPRIKPNPFPNPNNVPSPKPVEIQKPNQPVTNLINNQIINNQIINNFNIQAKEVNDKNRIRRKEECCEDDKKKEETPIYIGVPEWWQVRIGSDRPQAVVLVREVLPNGKLGSCWSMSIPHYIRGKAFKPVFPDYFKGDKELIYTFKDNSKFIINALNEAECMKVWNYVKTLVNSSMLTGKNPRLGDRSGEYKKCKVRATRLQFYSKGQKSIDANDYVISLI